LQFSLCEHAFANGVWQNWESNQQTRRLIGLPGAVMEIDEIRAILQEARGACAEARETTCGITTQANANSRQAVALARLIELTESLLAEREAFSGRLRRSSAPIAPPPVAPAVSAANNPPPATSDFSADSTP
jgi:hypothetical protein